ncbi:SIR2 family protein [Sphingobium yanoikuyae]|uniref:SIR2 family protein n=1 Tax=Sphingobium yanoikuyae TaxID=13690 RepID=UPI0026ED0F3F|nr:SIR2 family protein [Sphingobium yanoikuyae]
MDYDETLERLRDAISTGGAVCLLGAGFSTSASDQKGDPIPGSSDLVEELKHVVGIERDDPATLTDIADFCEESADLQRQLRLCLLNRLTMTCPSAEQKSILDRPWRSIFTTNFDDVVEQSLGRGRLQVITPATNLTSRDTALTPIYYLHGRAKDLVETDRDPRFVISEKNYLNLHSDNRDLYAQLKNELFAAKLIVIVGYSMRDLEVARMLIEPGHAFHKKTIVICGSHERGLAVSRLRKFGHVLPIGVDGLSAELLKSESSHASAVVNPQFIDIDPMPVASAEVNGDDFVRLILTGDFKAEKYQAQLQGIGDVSEVYSIRRSSALAAILDRPAGGLNRFVVSSDLGNGKTIFIEQLAVELISSGYRIVRISSRLDEVFSELDQVMLTGQPTAFLIDDVIRYRVAAQYIGARLNSLSVLICCMRGAPEEVVHQQLTASLGGGRRSKST